MTGANPLRGEVVLAIPPLDCVLRPTFSALVAAEAEVGSLLALLERAGSGDVRLGDIGPLFWHSLVEPGAWADRSEFEARLAVAGLTALIRPYRALLSAVFGGQA